VLMGWILLIIAVLYALGLIVRAWRGGGWDA
jgi:hypothetical protein